MRSSSMRSTRAAVPKAGAETPGMTRPAEDKAGRGRLRNWWRKLWRNPYVGDLRLIRWQYRHLYRDYALRGSCGHMLGVLYAAYLHGHLVSQSPPNPAPSPPEG